jgi:fatty acid desaturase
MVSYLTLAPARAQVAGNCDPREAPRPRWARWATPLLNDPRDLVFVDLMLRCAVLAVAGVALFFAGPLFWYLAPVYWVLYVAVLLDRFTLMLHCTSHRQLFRPRYAWLNQVIPWVLAPFLGQTPEAYFAHHIGMHHAEENLAADLSSTMRFRRDRIGHWIRYYVRFLAVGFLELVRYFVRKRRWRLLRRILAGAAAYWTAVLVLFWVNPAATLAVFIGPLLLMRTLMMMGNWAQHAFVCSEQPANPFRASLTCVNTRYNRRCFNDGYHAIHHQQPRLHWSEHPVEFDRQAADLGRQDAIVLSGLDFFQVWALLMAGRWQRLARAFVQLPGAPERSEADVIALLKGRVLPIAPAAAP